jgi:lysophospholipase L1-like esterase
VRAGRRRRTLRAASLAIALLLLLAGSVDAAVPANPCTDGPVTTPLVASASRLGVIDLYFFGALGAPVDYVECVGGRAVALGRRSSLPGTLTPLYAATSWRCARLARHFAATATLPDGSLARGTGSIRTRSCAQRFELRVRRVARGGLARVRIRDRWRIGGVRTKLCVTRPGGRPACRSVIFKDGRVRERSLRMGKRGRWRVELRVPGHRTRLSIAVGVPSLTRRAPPPTLLATGDSTMDGLDSFLSDQLGDTAAVVSEVEPGMAISKDDAWQPIAVRQVARLKPKTTVVSIGANEGWPMRGADGAIHECCDEPWVAEYSRRVRRTMVTYGHRVFWCTIVAPMQAARVPIFAAANAGILRAAEGLSDVHVVRLDLVFTPNGYRDVIRYRGRAVRVREPDGIHLNIAGAQIAASEVVKALRAAG